MKMNDLVWSGKRSFTQQARTKNTCDVSIKESIIMDRLKARFIFRNGVSGIISETDYVQFSVVNKKSIKRVYFLTGDHDTGLKMTSQNGMCCDNRYVQVNKEADAKLLSPFAGGDYEISFDNDCNLYYIEKA